MSVFNHAYSKAPLYYLRAESTSTTVDDALEGFVAAVGEDVSLQPSPGAGGSALDLATLPVADEVVATGLCYDVSRLKSIQSRCGL